MVYVACGSETVANQVLNSIRSALYFSTNVAIKFHLFTQSHLELKFISSLSEMHAVFKTQFSHQIYQAKYPDDKQDWIRMFRECATMRLFLPRLLTDLEAVLYMDSDTLFIDSVSYL